MFPGVGRDFDGGSISPRPDGPRANRLAGVQPGSEELSVRTPIPSTADPRKVPSYVIDTPAVISEGALTHSGSKLVKDYVAHWLKNPDPGSAFDRKTKPIRWLPRAVLFKLMQAMKYDGLVFVKPGSPGEVVAHAYAQKRGKNELHMFSVGVDPDYRGQGLAGKVLMKFLEHAKSRPDIGVVRLGAGGHEAVVKIVKHFEQNAEMHGLVSKGNGFFELRKGAL